MTRGSYIARRRGHFPQENEVVQNTYTSGPVEIPETFLKETPPDAHTISLKTIDFKNSSLPEYDGATALILDNVLSVSECNQLLALAEETAKEHGGWRQAMLNAGGNYEVLATESRNSDRIIWDSPEMVDRIWQRCIEAQGVEEILGRVENNPNIQGALAVQNGQKWEFSRLNDRMRFLRYREGQYFKRHCDGSYENPDAEIIERSLYTLHLYLNDDPSLKGGATSFFSRKNRFNDDGSKLSVEPVPGRVLVFQHRNMLHAGDEVFHGEKFTMRTDIMYQIVREQEVAAG